MAALRNAPVDFVVVGAVAAVLQGAPIMTLDLDLVHSREPANIRRLLAALGELQACYRFRPDLKPDASHLGSPGRQLLMTCYGPLDLLGAIGNGRSYGDLLPHAAEMTVGESVVVRVLGLATLIEVKEETAGEKDLAVLPTLHRTLEERRKRQG